MAAKSTAAPVAESTTSWENPLIPNKRLREIYTAMVEMRLLEEHIAQLQRRRKASERLRLHRGEEGCFVSTVLSLNASDLTSEASTGIAIEFLNGTALPQLIEALSNPAQRPPRELPPTKDASGRLHIAIGAAVAQASKKKNRLVVAYVSADDLAIQDWKPLLRLAANEAAPIIFVVLSSAQASINAAKQGKLSHIATACGVPGIPIDAADPVALYRVAQESMLRARAGGGPVLMECIPFQLPGKHAEPADPIITMRQFMLPRGVATEAWFESVTTRFATRLRAVRS